MIGEALLWLFTARGSAHGRLDAATAAIVAVRRDLDAGRVAVDPERPLAPRVRALDFEVRELRVRLGRGDFQ